MPTTSAAEGRGPCWLAAGAGRGSVRVAAWQAGRVVSRVVSRAYSHTSGRPQARRRQVAAGAAP